ncbi:fibronectin type III domain-containing protein [Nocardioides lijunqiniae]|uniref:fibronectin type III domain-containing protein n=1 Tax=Nocardioides lijunqiniae TaxID=2760832 RepID=UPI00187751A0|nr:fibronectin type III domain-containing protein [Nocardioides lijunqiniae]
MKLSTTSAAPRGRRRAAAAVAAVTLSAAVYGGLNLPSAQADSPAADITDIVLTVGADETERVISWSASTDGAQGVQIAPSSTLTGDQFPASAVPIPVDAELNTSPADAGQASPTPELAHGYLVLEDLKPDTEYTYRVGSEGHWSTTYEFKTGAAKGDFDFLFLGDPQIGSSGDVALDGKGWGHTLDVASELDPDAELYVSGGDQVDHAGYETEWDAFLAPDQLRSTPFAATIGNHDVGRKNYEQHFHVPNHDASREYYANGNPASNTSGGNYWYMYKDVLFVDINSNSYQVSSGATGTGNAAHINYVTDVIEEHGAEAKWTVLVYHHSVYSPAAHADDGDAAKRRLDFPKAFSRLGVDVVLQGHDHSYSRSYLNKRGAKADAAEKPAAPDVTAGPGGVLYVTANSASGSKYYDLSEPDVTLNNGDMGPDPLDEGDTDKDGHVRHWANSVENQEHVPTYIRVSVTNKRLTVANIRSGECDGSTPNPAVQRNTVDGEWCGTASNALSMTDGTWKAAKNPQGGVGSVQDQVNVHRVVSAPAAAAIKGTPKVGSTLTATVAGEWTPGTTPTYRWKADGVAFGGTGSSVVLRAAQLGKAITVEVVGSHELYEDASVTAPATSPVVAGTLRSATPRVTGTPKVGKRLTAAPGAWTAGTSFSYRWMANGKAVAGATGRSLTVTGKLKGKRISVQVTGRLAGYATVAKVSSATAKVKARR